MKATIIYHSVSGNTKKMAEMMAATISAIEGIEAKAFSIEDMDYHYAKESQCLILGTPIYYASASAQMHTWIQTSFKKCEPVGKLGGAFATANYVHGGGELGIRVILDAMLTIGMLTYSGATAPGEPVIHLGPVGIGSRLEETQEFFKIYARRMASKALELF